MLCQQCNQHMNTNIPQPWGDDVLEQGRILQGCLFCNTLYIHNYKDIELQEMTLTEWLERYYKDTDHIKALTVQVIKYIVFQLKATNKKPFLDYNVFGKKTDIGLFIVADPETMSNEVVLITPWGEIRISNLDTTKFETLFLRMNCVEYDPRGEDGKFEYPATYAIYSLLRPVAHPKMKRYSRTFHDGYTQAECLFIMSNIIETLESADKK